MELSDDEVAAETFKKNLLSPLVLALLRSQGIYIVSVDARGGQIRSVLLQKPPILHSKLIGYWTRSLTDDERANSTTHRGFRAVVWAVL